MSNNVLSTTTPTAKKNHQCYLCGCLIYAGDAYIRRTGSNNGDLWSIALHDKCNDVSRKTMGKDDWEVFDGTDTAYNIAFCVDMLDFDEHFAVKVIHEANCVMREQNSHLQAKLARKERG